MKKLFGGINLTWKKLIIFAIITAVYTALMALIPITKETSFRDIAIMFEWWILFGIIIICNSKSPIDSALKCFVFFLISQPLIYLIQVPFSDMGWNLFGYYRYWFIWTLFTFPMGFIGYYIKKKNWLSVIILTPMLCFLALLGLGYLNSTIEKFPHHLISFICCFVFIIIIVLSIFDKWKFRIISFIVTILFIVGSIILQSGVNNSEFEVVKSLENYELDDGAQVVVFRGTAHGNHYLFKVDDHYNIRLNGRKNGKYDFEIIDESDHYYHFEYYFDDTQNMVVLKEINE